MRADQIRRTRVEKGWTQAQLAQSVGCGQAMISMIERASVIPSPVLISRITRALEDSGPRADITDMAIEIRLPNIPLPSSTNKLPMAAVQWSRPQYCGDFLIVHPLTPESVLIVAVDVAGRAPSVIGNRLYIQGWLHGWLSNQPSLPQLRTLIDDLSAEMAKTGIEAGAYIGVLSLHRGLPHTVSYEAVSCGFPVPLLICGPPFRTLESAFLSPPLPLSSQPVEATRIDRLSASWRLLLASDGLLSRLGGGDEAAGLKTLRRWQTGRSREKTLAAFLHTDQQAIDDEFLAVLQWESWDENITFDVQDSAECKRIVTAIRAEVEYALGHDQADAYRQAIVEAVNNAHRHAYSGGAGRLTIRFRGEPSMFRTEIEDEGIGGVTDKHTKRARRGFSLMKGNCSRVFVRDAKEHGTIVELLLNRLQENHEPIQPE